MEWELVEPDAVLEGELDNGRIGAVGRSEGVVAGVTEIDHRAFVDPDESVAGSPERALRELPREPHRFARPTRCRPT